MVNMNPKFTKDILNNFIFVMDIFCTYPAREFVVIEIWGNLLSKTLSLWINMQCPWGKFFCMSHMPYRSYDKITLVAYGIKN